MRTGLHLGLTALKAIGLTTLLALVVVGGLASASPAGREPHAVDDAYQRVVERAVAGHRCSVQGFDTQAHAASALIRTSRGSVRVVSFEKGWDVYSGRRPGRLIAVCLDDRRHRIKG